jgi:hypothetical protein
MIMRFLLICFVLFGGTGHQTARKALYHSSHSTRPLCNGFFFEPESCLLSQASLDHNPICASAYSWVDRRAPPSHWLRWNLSSSPPPSLAPKCDPLHLCPSAARAYRYFNEMSMNNLKAPYYSGIINDVFGDF